MSAQNLIRHLCVMRGKLDPSSSTGRTQAPPTLGTPPHPTAEIPPLQPLADPPQLHSIAQHWTAPHSLAQYCTARHCTYVMPYVRRMEKKGGAFDGEGRSRFRGCKARGGGGGGFAPRQKNMLGWERDCSPEDANRGGITAKPTSTCRGASDQRQHFNCAHPVALASITAPTHVVDVDTSFAWHLPGAKPCSMRGCSSLRAPRLPAVLAPPPTIYSQLIAWRRLPLGHTTNPQKEVWCPTKPSHNQEKQKQSG